MEIFKVLILTLSIFAFCEGLPGSKKGSITKSFTKGVFKGGKGSSSSSSSSQSAPSQNQDNFGSNTFLTNIFTTTQSPSTTKNENLEFIRANYCHPRSKISLAEIESALTCPGRGYIFNHFSNLAKLNSSNNSTVQLSSNDTTIVSNTNTTLVISGLEITKQTACEPFKNASNPCLQQMQSFNRECLSFENFTFASPIPEAYAFDLYFLEKDCNSSSSSGNETNESELADYWLKQGLGKCLSPLFVNDGENFTSVVSECHKKSLSRDDKRRITFSYSSRVASCVKDKMGVKPCLQESCGWNSGKNETGIPCNPLANAIRNYFVENIINLLMFFGNVK